MAISLYVLLLALGVSAAKRSTRSELCPPRQVKCRCGEEGVVHVPLRRCLEFDGYSSYCDDCEYYPRRKIICRKFKHCASCSAHSCTTCPPNKKGLRCRQDCSKMCHNGGTCMKQMNGTLACLCPVGFTGPLCQRVKEKECTIVTEPVNGNVTVTGRTAEYACAPGYDLFGAEVVECLSDGTWSAPAPFCDPICETPNTTEHLSFSRQEVHDEYERAGKVVQMTARCDAGYRVVGGRTVSCTLNGTWSSIPHCEKIGRCSIPSVINNGYYTSFFSPDSDEQYLEGTEVVYKCDSDYVLQGTFSIICQEDGEWTAGTPRCLPVDPEVLGTECPEPEEPENGRYMLGPESPTKRYVPGLRIVYSCNEGYVLHPSQSNYFCRHDGTWVPAKPPRCIRVQTCEDIGIPENGVRCYGKNCFNLDVSAFPTSCPSTAHVDGEVVTLPGGKFVNGSYVGFKCKSDFYQREGMPYSICNEDGTWKFALPRCIPVCGRQFQGGGTGLVYGGMDTYGVEAPWHVVLKLNNMVKCGGVLVGERWVLTAAHCMPERGRLVAEFGRTMLNSTQGQDIQSREIVKIYNHTGYKNFNNDIMVLKLKSAVELTPSVLPVCLSRRRLDSVSGPNQSDKFLSYVTGFGNMNRLKSSGSNFLQKAPMIINPNNRACSEYLERQNTSTPVTENMFCAGGPNGEHPCIRDSGSPLVTEQNHHGSRIYYLHGLVSWGPTTTVCTERNRYGVFTNVTRYFNWIQDCTTPDLDYLNY